VLLHEAFRRFESEEDARVLVLTGAGELAFCAGADLKATRSFAAGSRAKRVRSASRG